jgi:hypothetical protein
MERIPHRRRADAHRVAVLGELSVDATDDVRTRLPVRGENDLVAGDGSVRILDLRHRLDERSSLAVDACGALQLDGSLWLTVTLEVDPLPVSAEDGIASWSTVLPAGGTCPFALSLEDLGGRRLVLRGALEHGA